jgi:lysozyme
MNVPGQTVDLAKIFEGLHKVVTRSPVITVVPYVCPAGYWTIGYGHLCDKTHPPIGEAEAEAYLADDLRIGLVAALKYCPVLALEPQHRLAAITDFAFNCGAGALQTSTLRRRINEKDWSEAGNQLLRWVNGGGRVLPGLVRRRQAERDLLLSGGES